MTESERVYREELKPWLPSRVLDIHCHVGLKEHCGPLTPERIAGNWALEVGVDQSWEQFRENYRVLFPEEEVSALVFGGVFQETDVDANNAYVLAGAKDPVNRSQALMVTRPDWDASRIAQGLERGYLGIKPYPDFVLDHISEPSILDFTPREHLEALNDGGGILMMHLPRKDRLGDPDNIRELLEIVEKYPKVKLIVAHIGRSFCLPTAEKGLPYFKDMNSVYFDVSANLNADVFAYALEMVGVDRILFGSDLPVTMMKGVREHVGEKYINYTDAPYSWNTNRKSAEEEAKYTYYLYEEVKALIRAVKRTGLGKDGLEKIMYSNGARLLGWI